MDRATCDRCRLTRRLHVFDVEHPATGQPVRMLLCVECERYERGYLAGLAAGLARPPSRWRQPLPRGAVVRAVVAVGALFLLLVVPPVVAAIR